MPHSFQRYPLSEQGELLLPAADLDTLLTSEPQARLVDGARRIELRMPDEIVSIPIRIVHDSPGDSGPDDPRLAAFEPSTWVGKDGRQARIVWIDGRPERRAGL